MAASETPPRVVRPWPFALLAFVGGIPTGFLTIAFPFLAARAGMSLASIGAVVGAGLLANAMPLVWTPVVDLTLTLRRWVVIGAFLSTAALIGLALLPLGSDIVGLAAILAFTSQAAATLPMIAGSALMALAVEPERQSQAAGFWQAGLLFSAGLAGGVGVWLASHEGAAAVGFAMALLSLSGLVAILAINEPERPRLGETIVVRLSQIGIELLGLARNPRSLLVLTAVLTPIGVGAASFLWSGIAGEWGAGPGLVALVGGLGGASASAIGALLYARLAGGLDRMLAFLTTGTLLALAGVAVALAPRTALVFTAGTLLYAMSLGSAYAAFTALLLDVVGRRAVATKVSVLYSLGNVPVAYMPALNGWVHDRWSTGAMLLAEAGLSLAFVLLYLLLYALTARREGGAPAARFEAC